MKFNVNRLLSLALVLVMLVGILPISTIAASTKITNTIAMLNPDVLFFQDFENGEEISNSGVDNCNSGSATADWQTPSFTEDGAKYATFSKSSLSDEYGNSMKLTSVYDSQYTQGKTHIQLNITHTVDTTKVYRLEFDMFVDGNITKADGTTALDDYAFFNLGDGSIDPTPKSDIIIGEWQHVVLDLQPTVSKTKIYVYLGLTASRYGTLYYDNIKVTEYTPVADVADISTYCSTENYNVVLDTDVTLSDVDITLAASSSLDLNGHTLTANSVDGTEGGTLIDSSEAKSGRVIVGTTDEGVDMLYPAANNPQLPVKAADGSYALATVNLSDAYIQQTAASDEGFTLIFRPGFGTAEIVEMVGSGTSGVDMSLELSWTDVFGQSPNESTTINGFETVVASAYKNGKAIYAKFTNPGDTYQFVVKVNVTSSTGVTISSDVTLDADATYVNPTELGKHYYFASNFNSYSELPTEFKGRGDVSVKPVAASSSYDSLSMGTDAENGQYVVFDSEDKSEGMSFTLDLITDAANKQYAYTNLVVEMDFKLLNGDASSTGRSAQFLNVRKPTSGGTNLIYSTGGGSIRVIKADNTYANLGTFTTEWQTMKIEIDLDDQLAQVTMDGVDKGVYSIAQIYGNYFQITKTKGDGGMGIDNLKIYRYTDTNWNLTLPT